MLSRWCEEGGDGRNGEDSGDGKGGKRQRCGIDIAQMVCKWDRDIECQVDDQCMARYMISSCDEEDRWYIDGKVDGCAVDDKRW